MLDLFKAGILLLMALGCIVAVLVICTGVVNTRDVPDLKPSRLRERLWELRTTLADDNDNPHLDPLYRAQLEEELEFLEELS